MRNCEQIKKELYQTSATTSTSRLIMEKHASNDAFDKMLADFLRSL
jgi:hypothetical protein